MVRIEGRVRARALAGLRVVIYSRFEQWEIQPDERDPFTLIMADGSWRADVTRSKEYAALLVDIRDNYGPAALTPALPGVGGGVLAVDRWLGQ